SGRWRYYRLNNLSHNTVTPGEALQSPDATAAIVRYASTPERAFAIADLSEAYPEMATSHRRGIAMLDRARVLVQDEISGVRAQTPLTWRMLTGTDVNVSGRVATLTHDGRMLRAEIISPANVFWTSHPAKPPTAAENQNDGITALEAVVPAVQTAADVNIAVLLTPVGERWPSRPVPQLRPLDEWK
ncbi:MAG TPA: heparinase II/III family protein, partial [Opitutus sp.]|nr:heparinase II/III family protein [Opitutus sp.]